MRQGVPVDQGHRSAEALGYEGTIQTPRRHEVWGSLTALVLRAKKFRRAFVSFS